MLPWYVPRIARIAITTIHWSSQYPNRFLSGFLKEINGRWSRLWTLTLPSKRRPTLIIIIASLASTPELREQLDEFQFIHGLLGRNWSSKRNTFDDKQSKPISERHRSIVRKIINVESRLLRSSQKEDSKNRRRSSRFIRHQELWLNQWYALRRIQS